MKIIFTLLAVGLSVNTFAADTYHCEVNQAVAGNGNVTMTEFNVSIGTDADLVGAYKDSEWGWMSFKKDSDNNYSVELKRDGTKHITVSYYPGHDMYDYDVTFNNGEGILKEHTFLDCLGEAEMQAALVCTQI